MDSLILPKRIQPARVELLAVLRPEIHVLAIVSNFLKLAALDLIEPGVDHMHLRMKKSPRNSSAMKQPCSISSGSLLSRNTFR